VSVTADWRWYAAAGEHLADADLDWLADTLKVSLHGDSYTPDEDADDYFDDATDEVTGEGYAAITLAGKTRAYSPSTKILSLGANDAVIAECTVTDAKYAVLRKARGGAASADELVAYGTFPTLQSTDDGLFQLTFPDGVVLKLKVNVES